MLHDGTPFGPVTLAYEMYGELSPERDNAILLFHAFSGNQHAAGYNDSVPEARGLWLEECYDGWWNDFIGPDKALDTNRFCVICANWPGGCYGSTGPNSPHPIDGKAYGSRFPALRTNDIVDSQLRLLDYLGIEALHATVGCSVGGMFALNMSVRYPDKVRTVVTVASGLDVSLLQRLRNLEQVRAIESDRNFCGGDYYESAAPDDGLMLARMIAHKTFVSLSALEQRARRDVDQSRNEDGFYKLSHPVESYMLYQGRKFVQRFDANTYLRLLDIWQHYDLKHEVGVSHLQEAFGRCRNQRHLIFSIDSDVCYYPEDQSEIVRELHAAGVPCQHITVHSDKGHDAFLLQPELFTPHLDYTLREKW